MSISISTSINIGIEYRKSVSVSVSVSSIQYPLLRNLWRPSDTRKRRRVDSNNKASPARLDLLQLLTKWLDGKHRWSIYSGPSNGATKFVCHQATCLSCVVVISRTSSLFHYSLGDVLLFGCLAGTAPSVGFPSNQAARFKCCIKKQTKNKKRTKKQK